MKFYNSFLVRCWVIRDPNQEARAVIDIEHIQSGGHKRLASLEEVQEWMTSTLASGPAQERTTEEFSDNP
jgi:hypothetical protein